MQEKEQQEIDLEFVLNEFSNWAKKYKPRVETCSSNPELLSNDQIVDRLSSLRHRIWDTKQLTYVKGWMPKWLNPLTRLFRRKVLDRAFCDIQHANVDALILIIELFNETQKATHDREDEIKESIRVDLDEVYKRNLVLNEQVESLAIKSKELSTRIVEAIANSEQAMTSEHAKLIAFIKETRENLRDHMLHSTSAMRREMMTRGKLIESSIEKWQKSGSTALAAVREEILLNEEAFELSLEGLQKNSSVALSTVREEAMAQTKTIEVSLEELRESGTAALSAVREETMAQTNTIEVSLEELRASGTAALSAVREETMAQTKTIEVSLEELRESGTAALSAVREEAMAQTKTIEVSLEELRESGLSAVAAVRKKVSHQTKAIENSIEKILKHGSNSLSKKNMERVMAQSYYERMRGDSSWLKGRFGHRYRILQESLGKKRMAGKLRCLDLGCGRGEWLEVLSKEGHEVVGIDGDDMMTNVCLQKGFEVRTGDIVESLSSIENDSFDLISLFHVMEHFDMDTICSLLAEIFRIGRPGLNLVFEIPNIHNPFISSANFYLDPTHRTKLPLELIEHLLDVFDFDFVHARFLERNSVHSRLLVKGGKSGVRDERFDHMDLLVVAMARATVRTS